MSRPAAPTHFSSKSFNPIAGQPSIKRDRRMKLERRPIRLSIGRERLTSQWMLIAVLQRLRAISLSLT
jgi:hypothetical protein